MISTETIITTLGMVLIVLFSPVWTTALTYVFKKPIQIVIKFWGWQFRMMERKSRGNNDTDLQKQRQ